MRRVLIANRGEIAARILRSCEAMGLEAVMVYSEADRGLGYLSRAARAVCIGPAAATRSYLSQDALIMTALGTGCEGVHPGYGFLAENAGFAARCVEQGLIFVGPDAEAIRLMGDKIAGREAAVRHGVPVVPGCTVHEAGPDEVRRSAQEVGFPLLIKASGGGGGRGMRVVHHVDEVSAQIEAAAREAEAAFSNPTVYLERFFPAVHHVEVQILGDSHGNVIHLGERDCSAQRRHQKLVEESPSPIIDETLRAAMCADALRLAKGMGYTSAGTIEFIVDPVSMQYYFIEMNTRIQVEHPVTEVVHGVDLICEQLRVAAGEPISEQARAARPSGHAIEWRINAEDPAKGFTPSPGRIGRFDVPHGEGVRVDTFVEDGHLMSPYYDSLVAKLVVHGRDRADALARSREALGAFNIEGIATTVDFHRWLASEDDFVAGRVHTRWVEEQYRGTS